MSMTPLPAARLGVTAVYLAGLLQGLTLVSFPAGSTVLRQTLGLSDAQYGALFLPQVALAIAGALGGGWLAGRLGLRTLLMLALAGNALSQLALAGSLMAGPAAYALLLAGTGALGLGFGLGGAPLNGYPPLLFPRHGNAALVGLHTLLGAGLALGPVAAGGFLDLGIWAGFPLSLAAACLALAGLVTVLALPAPAVAYEAGRPPLRAPAFWLFAAIAVSYAFAEGTFSNWAVVYLHEARGLSPMTAGLALSVFWGALVAGRLLASVLVLHLPARSLWLGLPVLMIGTFLLLPHAAGPASGLALFALAGLACSAFFPLTIALAGERFPGQGAWVSSLLIAALMAGVGLGSFVIGPLREFLSFEQLYRLSALYPLLALLLALGIGRPAPAGAARSAPQTS